METIKLFGTEVYKFSRINWWAYVIYVTLIYIATHVDKNDGVDIVFVTLVHFAADIFIMMMFTLYARNRYGEGAIFQIVSMVLFTSIKVYTGAKHNTWYFLAADPVYALAALKNYWLDVKKIDVKWINYVTMSLLSVLLIFIAIPFVQRVTHAGVILEEEWVLITGLFGFAVALSTTGNERLRYLLSVIALFILVVGSALVIRAFLADSRQLPGLFISYFILPLTVLAFYLKQWPAMLGKHSLSV